MNASDTIFALSSGGLPSGIAVVRISGVRAGEVLRTLFGSLPPPRQLSYGSIKSGGETLDRGMVAFFPGPRTATGEDAAELHLHGSVAVVRAVRAALAAMPGMREAEPGEFTLRSFRNGRMDLTEVESLSDLVIAETEAQRRQALQGVRGRIRDICLAWRARIQSLRARVEAGLDFSDQDDVPDDVEAGLGAEIEALVGEMELFCGRVVQAEIVRDGYRVAIIGAPNAGKSSLLNALAMRDAAIVTSEAGTTRDTIEVSLDLGGYKTILTDTAGLREATSLAERMGVDRARAAARDANLVLLLREPGSDPVPDFHTDAEILRVGTKSDLGLVSGCDVILSTRTGVGVDDLLRTLEARMAAAVGGAPQVPVRDRHIGHIRRAQAELHAARSSSMPEIRAEHVRSAAVEVGRIVGLSDIESLLGEIFSRFCIGK